MPLLPTAGPRASQFMISYKRRIVKSSSTYAGFPKAMKAIVHTTMPRIDGVYRDYFMVGECVRFLLTSCEGSLNERVSAANE